MEQGYCEFCGVEPDSECIVCDRGRSMRYRFWIPAPEVDIDADNLLQARRKLTARYRVDASSLEPSIEMKSPS